MTKLLNLAICSALAGILILAPASQSAGATPSDDDVRRAFEEQKQAIAAQQNILQQQQKTIEALQRKLEEQQKRLNELETRVKKNDRLPAEEPQPSAKASQEKESPAGSEPSSQPMPAAPVGIAPEQPEKPPPPAIPRIFDTAGAGVLTPKGTLVIEPSLLYAHSSSTRVALVGFTIIPALTIGLIDIRGVNSNTLIPALTVRYGLTNRLELEVKVPYVYRNDSNVTRPLATPSVTESVFNSTGRGIGDIEVTSRYQINDGGSDKPYYIGFMRFKTTTGKGPFEVPIDPVTNLEQELPTGSGFYILQPGLAVLYPSDPAVLFGSLSYLWNMKRNVGPAFGIVDPGDGVNFNFGVGLSLNEKISLSLGYDHTVFGKTSLNGMTLPGSIITHVGVFLVGVAYRWNQSTFVNVALGVGATREAPDLQLTVRVPIAVNLFKTP